VALQPCMFYANHVDDLAATTAESLPREARPKRRGQVAPAPRPGWRGGGPAGRRAAWAPTSPSGLHRPSPFGAGVVFQGKIFLGKLRPAGRAGVYLHSLWSGPDRPPPRPAGAPGSAGRRQPAPLPR
jgi:hypothetical protein